MARSKSSASWMSRHLSDPYVKQAQKDGYRSRSAYKLIELNEKDKLIRPGMRILDLGSAPGGWSQVAAAKGCKVIALDLLPLHPIHGVEFIQGDFREEAVLRQLEQMLNGKQVGLVISDMAPNISGVVSADQARAMHLAELAMEFALEHLKPGGGFLVKVFQGAGFEEYFKLMRSRFARVVTRKPKASRDRSTEVYLLGTVKLE
jgi:23S rRNA (uridine2552-2'-O)-methyltransferase